MADKWEKWQKKLLCCRKCDLCLTRNQVVPAAGNRQAKIMLLGEAPGAQEDLTGKPFYGAAGQKLDNFLDQIGLLRDDVYISNLVKCRPVKPSVRGFTNRPPLRSEKEACQQWLCQEMALLCPRLIITLGAVPLSFFVEKTPRMQDYHGRPFANKQLSAIIFPLFHPAAVIYDPHKEAVYLEDLQKLRKMLIAEDLMMEG
ncbi:MAG: uracil-DNA glycosylase [Bacillota bacterium]